MELSAEDLFDRHAAFCKVFSSPTRLRIMWQLNEGEKSVGDLAETLGIPLVNASQHLRVMKDRGAVTTRRQGRTIFYRITNAKFLEGARLVREGLVEELAVAAARGI